MAHGVWRMARGAWRMARGAWRFALSSPLPAPSTLLFALCAKVPAPCAQLFHKLLSINPLFLRNNFKAAGVGRKAQAFFAAQAQEAAGRKAFEKQI